MKKVESIPLYETQDFDVFKTLKGNRQLNQSQVRRLTKVVAENPGFTQINPIRVNEKMEIIDGQHRVAAHIKHLEEKEVAVPIFYVIQYGLTLKDAQAINAGAKAWNPTDYALAEAAEGNKNYKIYLEFRDLYALNHDVLVRYLSEGHAVSLTDFRQGRFVVPDVKHAHKLCEQLGEVGAFLPESTESNDHKYKLWKFRGFALPYLSIAMHPRYSHSRMLAQLEKYSNLLKNVPLNHQEVTSALRQIYNKGQEQKVDLAS